MSNCLAKFNARLENWFNYSTMDQQVSVCVSPSEAPETVSSAMHLDEAERRFLAPIGGRGLLECRVRAAPSPTFTWTAGDKEIFSDGRKYIIHVPQVRPQLMEYPLLAFLFSYTRWNNLLCILCILCTARY